MRRHAEGTDGVEGRGGIRAATLGALYALMLIVLGFLLPIIFFVKDEGNDNGLYLATFHIYIYTVSLFFLLYLQCCLLTKRRRKLLDHADSVDLVINEDEHGFKVTGENVGPDIAQPDEYLSESPPFTFTADGVNFIFRFGVILLGMGSVVLDGFRLLQFVEAPVATWLCYGNFFLADTALRLVFVFAETFFIFKNHKLVVHSKQSFARLGLVHLVATNLCMWAMVVVMETAEAYKLLQRSTPDSLKGAPVVLPTPGTNGLLVGPLYMNVTTEVHRLCHGKLTLADKAVPFLYPVAVEFALLAAALLAKIFTNVGGASYSSPHIMPQASTGGCHKANTGFFLGLIVVVVTCIVTCFFLLDRAGHLPIAIFVTTIVFFSNDLGVLLISLLVVLVAFCKVRSLPVKKPTDHFNMGVLFVGAMGYYGLYTCVLVAACGLVLVAGGERLSSQLLVAVCSLAMLQATAQVIFIMDTLRRHAASHQQLRRKPGRSLVTFLLIANMAMWIIDSFQLKELHTSAVLQQYYGKLPWQLLIHTLLPLAVLFRFYSAVCFGDIWRKAYKQRPGSVAYSYSEEHEQVQRLA